jgi:hypothetical protein
VVTGDNCLKNNPDLMRSVAEVYVAVMNPIPCTKGNVIRLLDEPGGARLTFTEKAS